MLSRITRPVDPRLEKAMLSAFGPMSKKEVEEKSCENDDYLYVYNYKPGAYTTHRRTACCPVCKTVAPHRVEKVLEPGKGSLLECVWCWSIFPSQGNCK